MKSLSDTRWSARADATEAPVDGYNSILNALRDIKKGSEHTPEARHEARVLGNEMDSLETALMAKIWNTIFVRFNKMSKAFQGIDVDMKKWLILLIPSKSF